MKKIVGYVFAIAITNVMQAQQNVHEIIIREHRLSDKTAFEKNASVQIITAADIQRMNVQSVSDVLHFVLGIQAGNRSMDNAQTDIKINGGTFEQTMILINGHPVLDPQTGHHLMNLPIHINDIHHLEIMSGPQAHSYGINGLAGSINIVTNIADTRQIVASAFAGSSFETDSSTGKTFANSGLHLGIAHRGKKMRQYFSVSALTSSGFMYNTAVNNRKVFYSNEADLPAAHHINLQVAYVRNAFGANGFYAAPYDIQSIEQVNTLWATLDHTKKIRNKWMLKSNLIFRHNHDDYIFKKYDPAYYHNVHKTISANANLNLIYQHQWGECALGANVNYQSINSSNLGKNERYNHGLFIENSINIKKFSTTLGFYGNYNTAWGFSLLPSIDLGYVLHSKLRLFASAGSANRMPTYTDLYYKGPSNIGNEHLQPEKSYGFDAGIKYQSMQLQLTASAFHRRVSNLIDWTKEKTATQWQPSNFGLQTIQGIQLVSNITYHRKQEIYLSDLTAKYQYIHSGLVNTLAATDSKYVLDYFKHQAIGSATVSVYNKFLATLSGRYQYRFNYHDYVLLDTRFGIVGKKYKLTVDVNNLLDTTYHESNAQPLAGRWFAIGCGIRFNYE